MGEHALILITCGDRSEAGEIGRRLVDEGFAAGVQLVPIDSVYRWQGDVVEGKEWLLIVKTRKDRFGSIEALVEDLHSYQVPPILMIDIAAAGGPYLDWIDETVG